MLTPAIYKIDQGMLKDISAIENLAEYVSTETERPKLFLIPALGDTHNKLVLLSEKYNSRDTGTFQLLDEIRDYHNNIAEKLIATNEHPVFDDIANTLIEIEWMLEEEPHPDPLFNFGQILPIGELLSSRIVAAWAGELHSTSRWVDLRNFVSTDNSYEDGKVNLEKTAKELTKLSINPGEIIVSQGYIGCTTENFNTVLSASSSMHVANLIAEALGGADLQHLAEKQTTG